MQNVAQHIIDKCGGHKAVADMAGVHVSRVFRWTYPKERGGTGGVIPAKHQMPLLQEAARRGIALEPEDFFRAEADRRSGDDRRQGERRDGEAA